MRPALSSLLAALPLAALPLVALPLALVAPPAGAATSDDVSLGFTTVTDGRTSSPSLVNDGVASTTQRVVSSGGGALTVAGSATGGSGAVQLPAYTNGAASAPRAVVAVTNSGAVDALSPRAAAFSFGADVRLDAVSSGTDLDNGNNVIQRGLFDAAAQYKLQLDGDQASCRVKGAAGSVQVAVAVPSQAWWRLTCSLAPGSAGGTVTLTAAPISASGSLGTARSASRSGAVGTLSYAASVPLSVGGKLSDAGRLVASADQLNGRIDNAWLHLG